MTLLLDSVVVVLVSFDVVDNNCAVVDVDGVVNDKCKSK